MITTAKNVQQASLYFFEQKLKEKDKNANIRARKRTRIKILISKNMFCSSN